MRIVSPSLSVVGRAASRAEFDFFSCVCRRVSFPHVKVPLGVKRKRIESYFIRKHELPTFKYLFGLNNEFCFPFILRKKVRRPFCHCCKHHQNITPTGGKYDRCGGGIVLATQRPVLIASYAPSGLFYILRCIVDRPVLCLQGLTVKIIIPKSNLTILL